MNWDQIKGKWGQMTGTVKSKWGQLTDDEITEINGDRERLVGKIRERYGIAKNEADRQVDDWMGRM